MKDGAMYTYKQYKLGLSAYFALGVGRWHPYGADRVSHSQFKKGISQVYPQHGSWAQRCNDNNI